MGNIYVVNKIFVVSECKVSDIIQIAGKSEFIRLMSKRMGYNLNWGNVDKEELLDASILSVDDYRVLVDMLKKAL